MLVEEVMTRKPYVAFVRDSIESVLAKLAEADVRHLPVTESGELVGIVSDRDLREVIPSALDVVERPSESARLLARPVSELMSTDVVSVSPGDDVVDAIDLMIEHRVGAVPVVQEGSTLLVGIVSYVDALRAARAILELE
jgi:CBS-domain-containing membrane protein